MGKKYYIAYGSNLNRKQMSVRCPSAKLIGTAEIHGWELLFKGSKTGSYLTMEPSFDGKVPVAIWEVTPLDERALDRYEGFPEFYGKFEFKLNVNFSSGSQKTLKAFAYIMDESRPCGIPSETYLAVCRQGYEDFGFDLVYLENALQKAKKGVRRHD